MINNKTKFSFHNKSCIEKYEVYEEESSDDVLNKYYAKGSPLVDIVFFIERSCAN